MADLRQLYWQHPVIGDISETVCPRHLVQIRAALSVLGIGCMDTDGSAMTDQYPGPDAIPVCLRCQAHPAMQPRELLRQWYGD